MRARRDPRRALARPTSMGVIPADRSKLTVAVLVVLTALLTSCASPGPRSPAVSPTPSAQAGCGPAQVHIGPASAPAEMCLAIRAAVTLTSDASELQPWMPLTSSDPAVLACVSDQHGDGSVTGVCTAQAPGLATVSTGTSAFAGDPHGPPQYAWKLTVTVQR